MRQAIAADDNYATAYAYAALWQVHNINQGWTADIGGGFNEALRLAAAAVDRDPTDGFALAIYGHAKAVLFRDYNGAIDLFDRALNAAPGNAMAWTLSSGVYSYTGQTKAAIERAEMGMRLSPVDTQSFFYLLFLALAHYVNGTYDESDYLGSQEHGIEPSDSAPICAGLSPVWWRLDNWTKRVITLKLCSRLIRDFVCRPTGRWCPPQGGLRKELLSKIARSRLPE